MNRARKRAASSMPSAGWSLTLPVLVVAFSTASAIWAHHSPSAVFDMAKPFTLTGTLTKVEWSNPHIVIAVEAKGENWRFESNPPSWFRRVGVSRNDFAKFIGQSVTLGGVRAKDGTLYGFLQKITFSDGNSMELVIPGEGAP